MRDGAATLRELLIGDCERRAAPPPQQDLVERTAVLRAPPDSGGARRSRCSCRDIFSDADEAYGVGRTAELLARVTAPMRANALPFNVAAVFREID